jgi:hypothetical protein
MSYQKVGVDFFHAVAQSLPADWRVATETDEMAIQQWFEPDSGSLIAQSVRGRKLQSSYMVHESYALVDRALS